METKSSDRQSNDILSFIQEVQVTKPSEQVVEQILALIASGKLHPGDSLPPERELAQSFGISRNYIREGIKTLELYGILSPMQGKATKITDVGIRGLNGIFKIVLRLTRGQILALVDTRLLLETETARLAALNPDPEEKRKLQECLEDLRQALVEEDNISQVEDKRVHIQIADMSGNPILAQLVRLITPELIVSYRELRNAHTRKTFAIHEALVAAIVAGDPEKSEALMREHLLDSKKNFQDAIEKRNSMRKIRSRQSAQ